MTHTATFTQTTQIIAETQQPPATHTFTDLLQPLSHDTNHLAPATQQPSASVIAKDLLQTGQILRPTRGFYHLNPTGPTKLEVTAATPPLLKLKVTAATPSLLKLKVTAATPSLLKLEVTAATPSLLKLEVTAATPPFLKLEVTAATPPFLKLKVTAATPSLLKLEVIAATTPNLKSPRPHKHSSKHKKWHGWPGQSKKKPRQCQRPSFVGCVPYAYPVPPHSPSPVLHMVCGGISTPYF